MLRKVFAAVLFGILSLSCTTAGERTAPSPPAARCSAARTLEAPFRCHFFELDKAAYVYPLGQLNGGHHEAQALALSLIQIKAGSRMAVFAPADMALVRYAHYRFGTDAPEWTLIFRVDDRLSIRFGALREPSRKIVGATSSLPAATSAEFAPERPVRVRAGEVIAFTTGTRRAHNWDIWVYDRNAENRFARPERYRANELGDRLRQAVCPYDLLAPDLRKQAYALLGVTRPGETGDCGNASRDVPGTLAGQWHFDPDPSHGVVSGEDGPWATPLAIYASLTGNIIIHEMAGKRWRIAPDDRTHKDPARVNGSHCYELTDAWDRGRNGYVYFKLHSATTLRVAHGATGACPDQFAVSGACSYYR